MPKSELVVGLLAAGTTGGLLFIANRKRRKMKWRSADDQQMFLYKLQKAFANARPRDYFYLHPDDFSLACEKLTQTPHADFAPQGVSIEDFLDNVLLSRSVPRFEIAIVNADSLFEMAIKRANSITIDGCGS